MTLTGIAGASLAIAGLSGVRAVAFDFNGTITSDDELQYLVYAETAAAELGVELDRPFFRARLDGLSDQDLFHEIHRAFRLRPPTPEQLERLGRVRLARYLDRLRTVSPVRPEAAVLIRRLAVHLPLALVTNAPRAEVEPVLALAGLTHLFATVLSREDVTHGKPHPEGYITAMERLAEIVPRLRPEDIVVFEDSAVGISAAGAAGMRTVAVHPAAGKHADLMCAAMAEMELAREGWTIG
ncbi:HAD family hydrolase [Nonomuraea endophytica]|uniref:HAD superfamily hydrolase (TIGR01509 family) n=1 Tax=Nonomuraea endophytica TaxID=714136 RepID=A0A7W8A3A6_9ACTN|nr:HAD family phosphatase [Nonomuraea endophytica]MBB5078737.1 HAD superfamily hydrolase (TIGR01509 family) [Nonomuraea endophytica]